MRYKIVLVLSLLAVAVTACSQGPAQQVPNTRTPGFQDPPDPFGFGPTIKATTKKDLSSLVAHCKRTTEHKNFANTFRTPCLVRTKAMTLKFEDYRLDERKRVISISGVESDRSKIINIQKLIAWDSFTRQYDQICVSFEKSGLPVLSIATKDQCDALTYGLL